MTTEQLLGESVEEAKSREHSAFDQLAAPTEGRIVLFGAGSLGRKALRALRSEGVEPECFADNDPAFFGESAVEGVPVLPLREAVFRWGAEALFVVTVFRPNDGEGMKERLRRLAEMGCKRTTSFLPLAWRYRGILPHFGADLPSMLLEKAEAIGRVGRAWSDEGSREIFRQQLAWRLKGDFSAMEMPAPDQYFPKDLIIGRPTERIVDGGAYDGDSLRSAPEGFERAWAFEPDPMNAARLRSRADPRITIFQSALGQTTGRISFGAKGTMASSRDDAGNIEVAVDRLDDLFADESPTFIKLDVEGDELAALKGGCEMIRRARPVMAVCAYHRPSDLWEVPAFLHRALPEHRLYLRDHEFDGFELVAYAVPQERCPPTGTIL